MGDRNGRQVVKLGGDVLANANEVINALVASDAPLFDGGDSLVALKDGALVSVARPIVLEFMNEYVAVRRVVNRGTEKEPHVESEYVPVPFDDRLLRTMMNGRDPRTEIPLPGSPMHARFPPVDPELLRLFGLAPARPARFG